MAFGSAGSNTACGCVATADVRKGQWQHVAFGKLELDRPGLGSFKKANTWLSEVDDLPFTILYMAGDRKKNFVGSGIERLVNRMNRVFAPLTENGTT